MRRQQFRSATSLFAAAAYLLAIALSSLSHVHVHPLADGSHETAVADHCGAHNHDGDHHCDHDQGIAIDSVAVDSDAVDWAADGHDSHDAGHSPLAHDDDCNICQFLGRPILAVTPFALSETSEPVSPLPTAAAPEAQPIVVVATQARAPPRAAHSI
ncbi:MAG TPA: hypothetical protein VGN12_16075 [Pirellulales bacterium]|jgi:hypothetical protein